MSNRLSTLGGSNARSDLKFKPKAVARKSKEEREASGFKINVQEKPNNDRKKYTKKPINQQRRPPRYLENTKIISSGPLAAGNFSNGGDSGRGFVKAEGAQSKLLAQGLFLDDEDKEEQFSDCEEKNGSRINMGRELTAEDFKRQNEEFDDLCKIDDGDKSRSENIAEYFPVRAVRVKHEYIEDLDTGVKKGSSDPTTRAQTPLESLLKTENAGETVGSVVGDRNEQMYVADNFISPEVAGEYQKKVVDHKKIACKLEAINNKPGKFLFLQLPTKLPDFVQEKAVGSKNVATKVTKGPTPEESQPIDVKKQGETVLSTQEQDDPINNVIGRIGTLRKHKSGKLSIKLGDTLMDIRRGADFTFLQHVIALDIDAKEVELLGQVCGRLVVTPKF